MTKMSINEELVRALPNADAGVLLAILVQLTGDTELLDRLGPQIEFVPNITEQRGQAEPEVHAEIVSRLLAHLTANPIAPNARGEEAIAASAWRPETAKRILEIGLGGPVDDEHIGILLEQGGFQLPQPTIERAKSIPAGTKVAIIGSGLAGINAALSAQRAGIDFEIFERNSDIGGTWLTHTYPGVGVDTPSQFYSISTHLKSDWKNYFPKGGEYFEYLKGVVDDNGIREHINFEAEVQALTWDDEESLWRIAYRKNNETFESTANYVIPAAGPLNRERYPDWKGRETFNGLSIHSSNWSDDIDLKGKRVAVIGTGCTAVQIVDAIAPEVERLAIIQRQPHWVTPASSDDVPELDQVLLRELPLYTQWRRAKVFWGNGDNLYPVVIVDPEWHANHLSISQPNDFLLQVCLDYIDRSFGAGSELAKKMTPDFAPFGKRIIRDPGNYYGSLKLPHVTVDNEQPIEVVPEGIVQSNGELLALDVIIYSTGYYLDYLSYLDITGRDGIKLSDVWSESPRCYTGGQVPGFPNLFITSGPNQSSAHGGSNNFAFEVGIHYFIETAQLVANKGASSVEVLTEPFEAHNAKIDADMEKTIWRNSDGAHTYYRNDSGRVVVACPWRLVDVWKDTRKPIEEHLVFASKSATQKELENANA